MVKLIIQGKKRNIKKHHVHEPQKVQSFGKSSGVYSLGVQYWYWHKVEVVMKSHYLTGL
jgi:hypothetical protein